MIGCELRRLGAPVNAGLQQARQAPRAQSSAAATVVTLLASLSRRNALAPPSAVRYPNKVQQFGISHSVDIRKLSPRFCFAVFVLLLVLVVVVALLVVLVVCIFFLLF